MAFALELAFLPVCGPPIAESILEYWVTEGWGIWLLAGLSDAGDADVDVGDGVPGRVVSDAVWR